MFLDDEMTDDAAVMPAASDDAAETSHEEDMPATEETSHEEAPAAEGDAM